MSPIVSFSLDLIFFLRCFAALFWGILWAFSLQHAKLGQFLAKQRTWLTVIIGIGVDGIISFGGDWWTCAAVIGCSSIGIILRSLHNEAETSFPMLGRNKLIWVFEDTIAVNNELIRVLEEVIETEEGKRARKISKALRLAHRVNSIIKAARMGEYEQKRRPPDA